MFWYYIIAGTWCALFRNPVASKVFELGILRGRFAAFDAAGLRKHGGRGSNVLLGHRRYATRVVDQLASIYCQVTNN